MRRFHLGQPAVASIAVLLLLVFVLPPVAFAKDNADFLQTYYVQESNELVFAMSNKDFKEEINPKSEKLFVSLDGEPLEVLRIEETGQLPVTFFCMVDISLIQNAESFAAQKDALMAIYTNMSDEDKMVIAMFGDGLLPSDYMTKNDGIAEMIEDLESAETVQEYVKQLDTSGHTNLYQSIVESITDLINNQDATIRKCLVVISDGQDSNYDKQTNSTVKSRADRAIIESDIPVYTITVVDSENTDADWYMQEEYQPIMSSFAQESAGGKNYNPFKGSDSYAGAGEDIVSDMKDDLLVTVSLQPFQERKKWSELHAMAPLEVEYSEDGATVYSDSMTVSKKDLLIDTRLPYSWYWAGGAALLLIVLVVIAVAAVRRKKLKQEPETPPDVSAEIGKTEPAGAEKRVDDTYIPIESVPKGVSAPTVHVRFTAIGPKKLQIDLQIPKNQELTLGRDQRADIVLNAKDPKLSGRHCRIICQEKALRVWDADSKNGTSVDGVPLQANVSAVLHEGQILWVGDYQYRIQFPDN